MVLEPFGPRTGAVLDVLLRARTLLPSEADRLAQAAGGVVRHDVEELVTRFPEQSRPILFADHAAFAAVWSRIGFSVDEPVLPQIERWSLARDVVRATVVALVLGDALDPAERDAALAAWRSGTARA